MSKFRFELDTAGIPANLVCIGLDSVCRNVAGLGFEFGKEGVWVVSFADFEKLYLMARAYRDADK